MDRRSFLSLALSPTLATAMPALTAFGSDSPECSFTPGVSETLFAYTLLLDSVFIDDLLAKTEDLRLELAACRQRIDEVFALAEELLKQLHHLQAREEVGHLSAAVHRGRRATQLLKVSETTSPTATATHCFRVLHNANQAVGTAAQNLLPPGQLVLDHQVKNKLQELIDNVALAHQAIEEERKAIYSSQTAIGQQSLESSRLLVQIRNGLLSAASQLTNAPADMAPVQSNSGLQDAIDGLRQILRHSRVNQRSQAEVLLQMLESLTSPPSRSALQFQHENSTPRLLQAHYSPGSGPLPARTSAVAPLPPGDFWLRVRSALGEIGFRPSPATVLQVSLCISLFAWIWAEPLDVAAKKKIIAKVLDPPTVWQLLGGSGADHTLDRIAAVSAKLAQVTVI